MYSLVFHLILTLAVIWYQKRQDFRPSPVFLAAVWYLVSLALSFAGALAATGEWFSGLFLQGLVVGLFYVPAVFFALRVARRRHDGLWRPFTLFLVFALVSTVLAAMFLAQAQWARGLN